MPAHALGLPERSRRCDQVRSNTQTHWRGLRVHKRKAGWSGQISAHQSRLWVTPLLSIHRKTACYSGLHTQILQAQHSRTQLHTQHCHAQLTHNSFTHNIVTHNSYTHNIVTHNSFTHDIVTHNSCTHNIVTHNTHNCHTQHCHTQLVTHNIVTHNSFTHNSFTHNIVTHNSFTQHCHTQLFHTQHCHTQLLHTQHCDTQLFTQHCHTQLFHTHLWHPQHCHTLGDIHVLSLWQVWHLQHWAGSGGALGPACAGLGAVVAAPLLRARRGTLWHRPSLCVAGVAHCIDLHFAWQAWHSRHWAGSGGALGLGCVWWRFVTWTAWYLVPFTCTLRGRRGARGTEMVLVACLDPLGRVWRRGSCAWQAWHLVTWTFTLCGRRGTCCHPRALCVAGVGTHGSGGALGPAWARLTPQLVA